ncbi:hypothetical protein MIR68_003852 [Amoeboaphelidium protococcarum]|nr:hypothetical protein MIR68_003852 [Amoeboaphelidium protococcarum]
MTSSTVLITGANKGIGLSLAKQFKSRGWNVLGTARKPDDAPELKQLAHQVYKLDVSDFQSIKQLAEQLKDVKIDLLINNAGVYNKNDLEKSEWNDMLMEYQVNALGPFFVSRELRPSLMKAEKPHIVNMTSRMGSVQDNSSGKSYGYRASKSALNALTKSWSIDVPEIPVLLTHPGYIQTGMTQGRGEMAPDECAEKLMIVYMDFLDGKYKTGSFLHRDGYELPW